jgi:hypothetical protein
VRDHQSQSAGSSLENPGQRLIARARSQPGRAIDLLDNVERSRVALPCVHALHLAERIR